MKLVIVESPSKAKTIKKYLGKDYIVKASKGHVIDLPKSKIGVDIEKNFEPAYEVTKPKVVKELKDAYKGADGLVLAVDLDREGEAIAWHIARKLGAIGKDGKITKGHNVSRIVFSEITKDAVTEAINNPRELNLDLVDAQQARRVLDRLVGYKLSPILWKKIAFGLSAGRVQSVALRLVVEKEDERRAFNIDEYWSLDSYAQNKEIANLDIKYFDQETDTEAKKEYLEKLDKSLVRFELSKLDGKKIELDNKEKIEKIVNDVKGKELKISDVEIKPINKNPKPPLITSTLQRSAVNKLGFTAKRTMSIAQKLYEKGYITYMRTDSTNMAKSAVDSARKYISQTFGKEYLPTAPNSYSKKSKNAQEAHECIRPVDFYLNISGNKDFTPEMVKIYSLIKNIALASQMKSAKLESKSIKAQVDNYEFKATGSIVIFDGYLAATNDKVSENLLPDTKIGDSWYQSNLIADQHFTQPPARYSEASLIKKLEELGIGRPSTYSTIISTIQTRKYALKEGRYLIPTDTGEVVNKLLTRYFNNVVDYSFTSDLENKLDQIADGKLKWKDMLGKFYEPFEINVTESDAKIPRDEFTVLGDAPENIKCPEDGAPMIIKLGRYGKFYSCSNYPDCKGILSIDGKSKEDIEKEALTDEFKESYESAPKTEDGRDYTYKKGKFGGFWAHPDYPKVKDAKPLVYKRAKMIELFGEPPKTEDGKQELILRSGKFGYFWAHPDYPKTKKIIKVKKVE
ncbi:MAG: type I DNA topoisomerase [Candidatus Dojkabacteria bacterium]|nr:type I DNA topoisomerase [Candidatus Dojkabacteria bacterium]MDQ7021778.1 type I DNA topoisomerase [Candidatus Dojkabacteria bacterium]